MDPTELTPESLSAIRNSYQPQVTLQPVDHDPFETPDYDYQGAMAAGVKPDERGHYPDTYKLPNHITFSDESVHNDGGAGHWDQTDGKWSFTPGPTNLKYHSMDELRGYFKKYEPDSTLIEPNQDSLQQPFDVAGDVLQFPSASVQRNTLRQQLLQGKQNYESGIGPPVNQAPLTIDQIKSRIPANDS